MKQLLKALDAGFTAFVDTLALPVFGFPLLGDDPADALEDVPVELAGSLSAPGDKPTGSATPEATAGGHPQAHDENVRFLARAIYENGYSTGLHAHTADFAASDSYWPLIRTAQALIDQGWQQM